MLQHNHPAARPPEGPPFDPQRPRSAGVLGAEELDWCRREGVPVGYDPVQIGWVSLLGEDDLSGEETLRPPWPAAETEPVVLRRWRRDEVDVLRGLLDDAEVWRWMPEPFPAPLTRELARDLIEVSLLESHHDVRAVEHDGRVVGQVRLLFDSPQRRAAEISYWLGRAHWGRGLGGQVVRSGTRSAFERHPDLQELVARVHPSNRASAAILVKAGYRRVERNDGWLGFARART